MNTISLEENQQKTASFEADFLTNKRTDVVVPDLSFHSLSYENPIVKSGVDSTGVEPPFTDLTDREPHRREPTPYSSYPTHTNPATNWLLVGVAGLVFLILIPPAVVLGTKAVPLPTATVSPLSEVSSSPSHPSSPSFPSQPSPYSPSDYLYLSQRYFSDAYTLSQKRQQANEDKQEILQNLQKAINTISEGIALYPNNAELLTQRANFYMAIQNIAPQAKEAAIRDIQEAQRISQHSPSSPSSPSQPSGLELVKDQQAQASRDVIVAAPDESTSPYRDAKESSAITGTATVPAGQTELTITNAFVTDAAPVYVVPKTQIPGTLSVAKKITGSGFTVTLDNPQTTDVVFQYWVTQ